MKKRMKKLLVLATMALLVSAMLFAAGAKEPAKPASTELEAKMSLYASITAIEPIMESFQKETGVQGEYTRLSTARCISTDLTEF